MSFCQGSNVPRLPKSPLIMLSWQEHASEGIVANISKVQVSSTDYGFAGFMLKGGFCLKVPKRPWAGWNADHTF